MSMRNCGSLMPNGVPVPPQQVGLPLAGRRAAGEQPDGDRDDDRHEPAQRLDLLAVAVEAGLLGRDRRVDRPGPVGDDQAARTTAPPASRPPTTNSSTRATSSVVKTLREARPTGTRAGRSRSRARSATRISSTTRMTASAAARRAGGATITGRPVRRAVRADRHPRTTDRRPHALLTRLRAPWSAPVHSGQLT